MNDESNIGNLHLFSFQDLDSIAENDAESDALESQEIKVEENISDPPLVTATCQNSQSAITQPQHHHRDIRTVLVKEETSLVLNEVQASLGSRHIRWNVEPVSTENNSSPCECKATVRAYFKVLLEYFGKYDYLLSL